MKRPVSHLASNQDRFFLGAVNESSNRPGLRVEVLHLCPVSEVVHGHLTPGVTQNKLALSGSAVQRQRSTSTMIKSCGFDFEFEFELIWPNFFLCCLPSKCSFRLGRVPRGRQTRFGAVSEATKKIICSVPQ